jgi:mannose-6-phosphate isomerase-like protein (cupin superfamily)
VAGDGRLLRPGAASGATRHAHHRDDTIAVAALFSLADIEAYFRERERLRDQGASAEQLRALGARHSATAAAAGERVEAAPVVAGDAGPDGILVTGRDTRNAYALAERCALPEVVHRHADQEEAFYVIDGELTVEAAGRSVTVPPGSFVLVPRGLAHRHVAGPGTRVLAIFSPGHAIPH